MLTKFLAGKLYYESTEYFAVFATTMTSQRLSVQSVALSAIVWPKFKGGVLRSQILGVRRCVSASGLRFAPIKSLPTTSQYLLIQSFALSAAVWPEFQCQVMPPEFSHHLGLGWV